MPALLPCLAKLQNSINGVEHGDFWIHGKSILLQVLKSGVMTGEFGAAYYFT